MVPPVALPWGPLALSQATLPLALSLRRAFLGARRTLPEPRLRGAQAHPRAWSRARAARAAECLGRGACAGVEAWPRMARSKGPGRWACAHPSLSPPTSASWPLHVGTPITI